MTAALTIPRREFISLVIQAGVDCERTRECASSAKEESEYHDSSIVSGCRHTTKHGSEEDNGKPKRPARVESADEEVCWQQQEDITHN